MKMNNSGLSSQHLKNFIVENTTDYSEALDCTISHVFKYQEKIIPVISECMAVTWPAVSLLAVTHREGE